ncbi:MAG TPA: YitT family protein [Bacteroidales bacterium]|nr:YitT family protein [Bacteroidales bacterium]
MAFVTKEKLFSLEWFKVYSLIVLGTFLTAVGYVYFIAPHKIVPGGMYGIAIVLHHTYGTPVGLVALGFNIIVTLIGIKVLGPRFGIKSVTAFLLSAVFTDLLSYLSGNVAILPDDILMSSIVGAVLIGAGVGFLFKARATAGGSDLVAMMFAKWTKQPVGTMMLAVDSSIVIIGLVAFGDWKIPLYSWIAIFVLVKSVDMVLSGLAVQRAMFIISDKYMEIAKVIKNDLNRGGTLFEAKGIFSNQSRPVLYTVVSRREAEILKSHISIIDPAAFITITEATEILGKGFKELNEEE